MILILTSLSATSWANHTQSHLKLLQHHHRLCQIYNRSQFRQCAVYQPCYIILFSPSESKNAIKFTSYSLTECFLQENYRELSLLPGTLLIYVNDRNTFLEPFPTFSLKNMNSVRGREIADFYNVLYI